MANKKEYVIGNEKGFFVFGCYVPTWYAGQDDAGDPVFKVSEAEAFKTRKSAENVLAGLPVGYQIMERFSNGTV